jgi:CheY-like chemotaxis protein
MDNEEVYQILVVDDDVELCGQIQEYFAQRDADAEEERWYVRTLMSFEQALDELRLRRIDLVVLDVKDESDEGKLVTEDAGIRIFERIREVQYVPIIFYTALPNSVRGLESHLVHILEKPAEVDKLEILISEVLHSDAASVNRALTRHVEHVQQDYMWNFVADHWSRFSSTGDPVSLAYLLARRLASGLSMAGIDRLVEALGGDASGCLKEGMIHPMHYYIMPPVSDDLRTGDIFRIRVDDEDRYAVLLTPSCDMVTSRKVKAESCLIALCDRLDQQNEYMEWFHRGSDTKKEDLRYLMTNRRKHTQAERYFFLPAALDLPDLIVDFQHIMTVDDIDTKSEERIASLDSPFAEALVARFARYYGRLGTPDLDTDRVFDHLNHPMLSSSSQ